MSESNRLAFKLETDLISLRTLVAVIEEGGFTAAARRVNRTQSAISLQIAKLEERLGVKLLERTSRSVSITVAGETFVSYARRILELADEAILAVTSPGEATVLRVGFAVSTKNRRKTRRFVVVWTRREFKSKYKVSAC